MGRLTTIEDVEKREAAHDDEQMRAAQEAMRSSQARSVSQTSDTLRAGKSQTPRVDAKQPKASAATASKSQAQQEVDFHGLDNLEKKSGGHIALIVVAVVIVVAAALKVANVF